MPAPINNAGAAEKDSFLCTSVPAEDGYKEGGDVLHKVATPGCLRYSVGCLRPPALCTQIAVMAALGRARQANSPARSPLPHLQWKRMVYKMCICLPTGAGIGLLMKADLAAALK